MDIIIKRDKKRRYKNIGPRFTADLQWDNVRGNFGFESFMYHGKQWVSSSYHGPFGMLTPEIDHYIVLDTVPFNFRHNQVESAYRRRGPDTYPAGSGRDIQWKRVSATPLIGTPEFGVLDLRSLEYEQYGIDEYDCHTEASEYAATTGGW